MLVPRSPAPLKRSALSVGRRASPLSVMSDELDAEEAKRRKLNDGSTSADPYGNGIDGDDDDLLESSYNEDMADFYGACASQTDNPNTPLAGRHDDDDKPRLKQTKSIQDRVHGQIAMNGLLVAAMRLPAEDSGPTSPDLLRRVSPPSRQSTSVSDLSKFSNPLASFL